MKRVTSGSVTSSLALRQATILALQNESPTKRESYEMRVQLQIEVITHNPKMEFEILNMVYINFTGILDVKTNQFLD